MQQYIILALLVIINLTPSFVVEQKESQSLSSRNCESFAIHILDDNWDNLHLGYTHEKSMPILQRIYKYRSYIDITIQDIVRFDWRKQQVILSIEATDSLKKKFKIDFDKQSVSHLSMALRAFVVTVDGQPAYGGIILPRGSQMAIRYPVIYIGQDSNGRITMDIRPLHSIFEMESSDPAWNIVRQDCIRDVFERVGKLAP